MPTKKRTAVHAATPAHRKTEVATHLFLGGAVTLLLVLAVAQFTLSRIMWEDVSMLKQQVSRMEDTQAKPDAGKEVTTTVTTENFRVTLPASFHFIEGSGSYTIFAPEGSAIMYPQVNAQERPSVQTGSDYSLRETMQMTDAKGAVWVIEFWWAEGADTEHIEQLRNAVNAIYWIP